jgi:DNA-binding PadR family transcriptional regulator
VSTRRAGTLTTTSYSILGLLAIRPWSPYEIAKHWDRSLGRLWPRARSKLYEEPRKLVAHGLARASERAVGRRSRTVYSITPKGRRALAAWLTQPGEGPVIEYEQLLKVFFGEHGTTRDVETQLVAARDWAARERAIHAEVARSYREGRGAFPERAAILSLTGRFVADFADFVGRWAEWALDVVQDWPDDPSRARPDWATFDEIAGRLPRE